MQNDSYIPMDTAKGRYQTGMKPKTRKHKNAKNKNQFLKERKLTGFQKAKARPLHNSIKRI